MRLLKKLIIILISVLVVFSSCTNEVPNQNTVDKTRGTLVVNVPKVDGAVQYAVNIGDKVVLVENGKASFTLDYASYDVHVVAIDKNNQLLAESYSSINFRYDCSIDAALEVIKLPRIFSKLSINMPTGEPGKENPSITDNIIILNTDGSYEKTEIGLGIATDGSVTPDPMPPIARGPMGPDSGVKPIPVLDMETGEYTIENDELTLTQNGLSISYKIVGDSLVAADEAVYVEVKGQTGGKLEGDFWSIPKITIPSEIINQFLKMIPEKFIKEIDPGIKVLAALNKNLEMNIGFRFFRGSLELYADVAVQADFLSFDDSTYKLTMEEPVTSGIRVTLPFVYNEKGGQISFVVEGQMVPFSFRRLAGGSIMVMDLNLPFEDTPFAGKKLFIPFARKNTSKMISGSPFPTGNTVSKKNLAENLPQFVEDAGIINGFTSMAKPKISTDPSNLKQLNSVLGVWTCETDHRFDIDAGYFDQITSKLGKLTRFYNFKPTDNYPLEARFTNENGDVTSIFVYPNTMKFEIVDGVVNKITANVSIREPGKQPEDYQERVFTRNDLTKDLWTSYEQFLNNNQKDVLSFKLGSNGRLYAVDGEGPHGLPIKYMVKDNRFTLYADEIVDIILKIISSQNPEMSMINPGFKVMAYIEVPYDASEKVAYLLESTSGNKYGLKFDY